MTTTIKVSDSLRDRLKEQASRDGLTLGAHLARLADAESYAAEVAVWERAELTDASS